MAQKFDARQTISRDVLSQLLGINGTELDDLLRAINKEFNAPLRISASSPADAKINFQPSEVEAADLAAKNITPVSSQIPSFPASTIDFQTGATTGGTINITFPNSTVGFFRRIGFSLDASGTIQAIFSAEAASLGALANAGTVFVKGALPIGWIDLEATAASPGRFKTAGSASNIIENKVGSDNRVHRIMGGGGSGAGGSGSGTGDDINALTFKASFTDLFSDLPTDSVSAVDYSAGKTDSTTYDIVNTYHRLAYDATQTVTGTGVNMTLSAPATFTIKAGDMLIVGAEARRIASLTSQTVFALESAFTADPSGAACTVSQAVHTKDLNNFAGDGIAVSTAFPTAINQILMTYEDTSAANDIIFDANSVAVIGFTASSDGSNFTNVQLRPQNLSDSQSMVNLPTSGTNLYLRMFANKSSGSGFVNILGYKAFFHRDLVYADGSVMNQAYARTDNLGTKVNVSAISVVSGKTRIKTSFSFPVNVNSGSANGSIKVYLDGQKLPRFVDGTVSVTAYYKEIDQNTIELDADYSSLPLEVEIVQDVAVVDASDTNTTGVAQLQETLSEGTSSFVKSSAVLLPTTATGSPAVGSFHSTIQNRAAIVDLTQDLKARIGIERNCTQQLYQVLNELGPNGEIVHAAYGDIFGLVRFVGSGWTSLLDDDGFRPFTSSVNDYVEITFYGTGLNLVESDASGTKDIRASIDGGAEGGSTVRPTMQGILQNRNTSANIPLPVYNGLTLGVHTVKLRLNSGNFSFHGYEVINNSMIVNPGSSFVSGRKSTTSAQASVVYNSSFESGTLGTRGGRVVVYQKADGTIAKAVQPVDAAQANYTSANHQNEEIARIHHFREFGAGLSTDFSTLTTTASNRFFTLDDGVTSLNVQNWNQLDFGLGEGIAATGSGDYLQITFVGTGLDIVNCRNAANTMPYTVNVDGTAIITSTAFAGNGLNNTVKLVSGLPYGTHTVRISSTGAGTTLLISKFIVYQPKKPTLPAGAFEIADYNVVANFSFVANSSSQGISTGVISKSPIREVQASGSGFSYGQNTNALHGSFIQSSTNADYIEYTFWGTGIVYRFFHPANTGTVVITIDGSSNLSGFTTQTQFGATSATFTPGTGTLSTSGAVSGDSLHVAITGLTLGRHTIRITKTGGVGASPSLHGFDVVTPIHSMKLAQYYAEQSTTPIGSQSISDGRKLSIDKENVSQQKMVAQAFGLVSAPSITSSSPVPVPDMAVVHVNKSGKIKVSFTCGWSTTNAGPVFRVSIDGQEVLSQGAPGAGSTYAFSGIFQVTPGVHRVGINWSCAAGTVTASSTSRSLTVEEV